MGDGRKEEGMKDVNDGTQERRGDEEKGVMGTDSSEGEKDR